MLTRMSISIRMM